MAYQVLLKVCFLGFGYDFLEILLEGFEISDFLVLFLVCMSFMVMFCCSILVHEC
jgi:hypothetical protein